MKFIQKVPEPVELTTERELLSQHESEPGIEHLSRSTREILDSSLLEEQGYICCYCGIELKDKNYHREHLIPQSVAPDKKLDYSNLLASCYAGQKTSEPDDEGRIDSRQKDKAEHCGDHRPQKTLLKITPLDPECESCFKYTIEGQILASGSKDAVDRVSETIEMLGLDCGRLKRLRKDHLTLIFEETDNPSNPFKLSDESTVDWLRDLFSKKHNGRYERFCFVVMYFLNTYFPQK